ncbi:UNVERIFIED_CONTAM: hypothetical protein RMT77_008726 [Armadillidium vulgare]
MSAFGSIEEEKPFSEPCKFLSLRCPPVSLWSDGVNISPRKYSSLDERKLSWRNDSLKDSLCSIESISLCKTPPPKLKGEKFNVNNDKANKDKENSRKFQRARDSEKSESDFRTFYHFSEFGDKNLTCKAASIVLPSSDIFPVYSSPKGSPSKSSSGVGTGADNIHSSAVFTSSLRKFPFEKRILTGNVKNLTRKFEEGVTSHPDDGDKKSLDKQLTLTLSRLSRRMINFSYVSVDSRGNLVRSDSSRKKYSKPSLAVLREARSKDAKRLSENLSRRDGELNLLIREGENVTSRLRNVLTTSLRSPGPVFRPPLSTQPPRHSPPEPQPRGFSPGRYSPGRFSPGRPYRSELTLEDETTRPLKSDFTRSRSLSDIRQQQQQQPQPQQQGSDRSSRRSPVPATSTPLRARRDIFNSHRPFRDISTINSDILDDTELYRLEEETRGLQEEVARLKNLLVSSKVDHDQLNVRYNILSDHASEEWHEYQIKLQHFHEIQNKQTNLIERLANKVKEYKVRCREHESHATDWQRKKDEAERQLETLSLALATSEERLRAAEAQHTFDLETALIKLEDEQSKCESLVNQVTSLQEKMTQCQSSLAESSEEKEKLSSNLRKLQEEIKSKEAEWSQQSQQYNNFYISEHKNLLDLWREVGSVKRTFGDVKTSTLQDLQSLKESLNVCSTQLKTALVSAQGNIDKIPADQKNDFMMSNAADLWARIQDCERAQTKLESEKSTLKEKINDLNSKVSELNNTLRDKDRCIQDLNRKLDDGLTEAEIQETLREKVRTLETYLVDIAQTVIKDSEHSTVGLEAKSPPSVAFKLSRDLDQGVSPDLPQSTVSAVRTALSNRQVQIHDLQLKLTSSKEQLANLRKQYDATEASQRSLEATIAELRDELEAVNRIRDDLVREKDRLNEDFDAVNAEKLNLNKTNQSLKIQLQTIGEDTEKRNRQLADLEKEKLGLIDEKAYLTSKLSKEREESQKLTHTINLLSSELSSAQAQVSNLSDSLSKAKMAEEKVEQEREEIREHIRNIERDKIDLEAKVNFLLRQEADLKDALEKVEAYNISLGQDKSQLVSRVSNLEAERATLNTERIELRAEIERYKDEIEAMEDERGNLEATITSLNEKLNIATVEKEKIELELSDAISERNEIHGHLAVLERTRSNLEADIESISNALDDKNKLVEQLNQDKEVLSKENAEMEIKLSGVDKEMSSLKESMATLKAEKQSLENFSSSLEKKWANNEARRTQLEKENQQLSTDKERISTQMNKLQRELETELSKLKDSRSSLERKLDEAETEHKKKITQLKDEKEEVIDSLRKEKNEFQSVMEDKINMTLHAMRQEMDELETKKDQELSSLKRTIEKLQRERDDASLRYEEEKHKSLAMAQQEISSLEEKVSNLQRDLTHYENQLEQLKKEGSAKVEVGRAAENILQCKVNQLKEELHNTNLNFEKQSRTEREGHEKKLRDLQTRLDDMRRDHDLEISSLKTDLRLAKEDTMRFQQDLEDAEAKLKDAQDTRICMKKEMDRMGDDVRMIEERKGHEYQMALKRIECEKKDLHKKLEEKDNKIAGLEATETKHAELISRMTSQLRDLTTLKQDTQREISDLRRKLQVMETEGMNKSQEIETLRQRLCSEEDRHNESRKEASKLKTKHAEYERERENLQTELALLERRLSEIEDHHAAKEQELASSLQESRANERKLMDEKKNLENYWNNANQQISDLKIKLSREEGHVDALEQQLSSLETNKEQLEKKLHTVYASLRTVTRMYQDQRPSSPTRRGRKSKMDLEKPTCDFDPLSFDKINISEIDPESIRHELRSLMSQMSQIELERDDAVAKVASLEKQLSELQEAQQRSETRLRDVTRTLSELEEKKRYADDKLNKSSSQITHHEDALRRKESEIRALTEELSNVKRKAADLELDRNSLSDRLSKMKSAGGRLEMEHADLKERLRAAEQRMSLVDESKGRLEADLTSMKKSLSEKQLEIESVKSDKDNLTRSLRILEDQNASFKVKLEDVKSRLSLVMSSEAELKDKLSSSNRNLKEHLSSSTSLQDELNRLQSQLSRNDNERRQLEERLVESQASAAELRRQKDQLSDSKSKLQQDLSNVEIKNAELEMTLKSLKGSMGGVDRSGQTDDLIAKISRLEQEKLDLKNKLSDLERKVAILSAQEKIDLDKFGGKFDKERLDLRKYLDKFEHELPLSGSERSLQDTTVSSLRIENMELRRRIDNLETEKTELQQKHLKETLDISSQHRKDRHDDNEKLRRITIQLDTLRQEKERCLLKINALEQQIQQYREQIREYRNRSSAVAADVRRVRMSMTESLHNIGTHPRISSSVMDSEIQNLSGTRSPGRSPGGSGRPSRRYGSLSPRRRTEPSKKTSFAAS